MAQKNMDLCYKIDTKLQEHPSKIRELPKL